MAHESEMVSIDVKDSSVNGPDGAGRVEIAQDELYIDPAKEKILLAKLDIFLNPIIMLVYLCCFLDRSNIGRFNPL